MGMELDVGMVKPLQRTQPMSSLFILENSIDLFYVVTNQDGKIVTNNELFKNYVSHLQPTKITDIISIEGDKEDFIKAIETARKHAPEPSRVYARTRQKNASDRYNVWNCFAIGETLHFVGIQIVDVTSISSHDYERQRLLLEEFRFMLSHEIRQPLTNIAGLVQMLMQHQGASDLDKKDVLSMINTSVNKLDAAIKILVKKAAREL
jgi:nitrogen-specific signal transduction histidine kinase